MTPNLWGGGGKVNFNRINMKNADLLGKSAFYLEDIERKNYFIRIIFRASMKFPA
jgi:hypothetical protein